MNLKWMNLWGICCISAGSTAICFPLEKEYLQKKDGNNISEHTRLLEGQRSAVLRIGTPKLDKKNIPHGRIEGQVPELKQNPKVVVLKVSLHCQGCAKKVRRHLSKMEGVISVAIDLEKKMVTVMGNVSPIGILESVCKVKNAELWPSSIKI
ncbi:hypothetical protein SUGI_0128040 [Cryptomeria japonica]|nr:hypothetical protein SUGI_0128040 [Cryptomeria japonica]